MRGPVVDNGINETDIVKHRYELGPAVKALAFFVILVGTSGATWYVCKQNTKGDIATSEIEVRKDDSEAMLKLQTERDRALEYVDQLLSERAYDTDCASMPLVDMRNRVREPEVD